MLPHAAVAIVACASIAASGQTPSPEVTLTGNKAMVLGLTFSPDGKQIASLADDGVMKVWDVASQKEIWSIPNMLRNTNRVCFAPDGKSVATISSSNTVLVFDAQTGKELRKLVMPELHGGPRCIDLSPDGKTLAVVGRGKLLLLNFEDGAQTAAYEVHKGYGVNAVAWSPDGASVATAGTDRIAMVTQVSDGTVLKSWPVKYNGNCVAFARDGKTVYVATDDRTLRVCELAGDDPTVMLEKGVQLLTLAMSQDGKTLVVGGAPRTPWLVSTADRTLAEPTMEVDESVKSATISPDGAWIAGGGQSGAIYLWKAPR